MGVGGKGKGKKGAMARGHNTMVQKNPKSHGEGAKAPQEKRIDPSDGNGPFNHASFLRFHGEKKGEILWKKAGVAGADQAGGNQTAKKANANKGKAVIQKKMMSDQGSYQKFTANTTKGGNNAKGGGNKTAPGVIKKGNKGKGKGGKEGAGNKGKGKGKNAGGPKKPAAEKRLDPSDGNGPFTKESFIRFHGQEKGEELWEQAGAELETEPVEEEEAGMEVEEEVEELQMGDPEEEVQEQVGE